MSFPSSFFSSHRQKLIERTGKGPVIVSAYTKMQRMNDAAFPFQQEANFWYLTGISAPDWQLIIDESEGKSWLVAPEIDEVHRTFDGSLSHDQAIATSAADGVLSVEEGERLIKELSQKNDSVWTLGHDPHGKYYDFALNPGPERLHRKLSKLFPTIKDAQGELAKLRAIKTPEEIDAIRRAVALTAEAFVLTKKRLPQLRHEYEVEAEFTYHFRKHGARHAYDPIVAGGVHSCTLHYGDNEAALPENGLLLLDIGARVDGYAADVTRTYRVGTPTARHRTVHAAVVDAQERIIASLKPGLPIADYQERVDDIMKEALEGLGLLRSPEDFRKYFPHAISHGLGIDVHDALGRPETFQPGMVLTVEPGIYIPEEGIGVRIEDDILITETGHENLSASLTTDL